MLMTASQADLQLALNAVHAWGVCWRFSFGINPTKSATMVSGPLCGRPDCHVHLGGVPLPLVQQYRTHSLLGALTSTFGAFAEIVSFTRPVLGALVKGSLSPSCLPSSSYVLSSPLLDLSSLLMILLQFNLALRRWCRHLFRMALLPLLLQHTGNLHR